MRAGQSGFERLDLLWLAAAIWFGLGVAHNNRSLTVMGLVCFAVVVIQRRRGRRRRPDRDSR